MELEPTGVVGQVVHDYEQKRPKSLEQLDAGCCVCCRKVGHAFGALANCLLGSYLCVTECYYCRKFDPLGYCLTACCCPETSGATTEKNPAAKVATEPGGYYRATTGSEQYSVNARDPIPAYVG